MLESMLTENMVNLLNQQINMELFSEYLYLDIANYYAHRGLLGFAHWFEVQVKEERYHAMLIREYLLDNEEEIQLLPIDQPKTKFKNDKDPLVLAHTHEREITKSIHKIYAAAMEEKDYRTLKFLGWFIDEQMEEEASTAQLLTDYELYAPRTLFAVDKRMGRRPDFDESAE